MRENCSQRVGNGTHRFDEDIQSNADYVLTGITDCIAGDCRFMSRTALFTSAYRTAFDILLGIIEGAAGITHEDRTRDRGDRRADQHTADEINTEQETADDRDQHRQDTRQHHFP